MYDIKLAIQDLDKTGTQLVNLIFITGESIKGYKTNGNKLIYIGEGGGGCTGCDKFHSLLYSEWLEVEDVWVDIPQWTGMHDGASLFIRK